MIQQIFFTLEIFYSASFVVFNALQYSFNQVIFFGSIQEDNILNPPISARHCIYLTLVR